MTGDLPIVVAVTGGSGAAIAVRLLNVLLDAGRTVHLSVSESGAAVVRQETDVPLDADAPDLAALLGRAVPETLVWHHHRDLHAGIASGSHRTAAMVIVPCSMSSLASIAHGITGNLIQRAAEVHLKERRKLILVPRETPLSLTALENMAAVTRAGAVVLPAMPGWYHHPKTLDDLIDFLVARICDQLELPNALSGRWGS